VTEGDNSGRGQASGHHVGKNRIRSVDVMRGTAMVLVIVQHCYQVVDPRQASAVLDALVYLPTRMASVGFMAVSGMMISFFLNTKGDPVGVQQRFARRALLLVLAAHPAIHLARLFYYGPPYFASFLHHFRYDFQITDTIAVALVLAPPAIRWAGMAARGAIAVGLLAAAPVALIWYQPSGPFGHMLKAVLFGGELGSGGIGFAWPLAPWVGIFLLGSLVGQMLARMRTGGMTADELAGRLRRAGLWLMALGLVLNGAYKVFQLAGGALDPRVFDAVYPSRTTSLLPIYLAVLLWIFSFYVTVIDGRGRYGRAAWALSVFGRTSLFTYVTQFVFAHSVPGLLGVRWRIGAEGFVLLLAFALPASWALSYAYGRWRGWIAPHDYALLRGTTAPRGAV